MTTPSKSPPVAAFHNATKLLDPGARDHCLTCGMYAPPPFNNRCLTCEEVEKRLPQYARSINGRLQLMKAIALAEEELNKAAKGGIK
jgi:hypothetical protein